MTELIQRLAKFCLLMLEFLVYLPFHVFEFGTYVVAAFGLGGIVAWVLAMVCMQLGWPTPIAFVWGVAIALYLLSTKLYERYFSDGGAS